MARMIATKGRISRSAVLKKWDKIANAKAKTNEITNEYAARQAVLPTARQNDELPRYAKNSRTASAGVGSIMDTPIAAAAIAQMPTTAATTASGYKISESIFFAFALIVYPVRSAPRKCQTA